MNNEFTIRQGCFNCAKLKDCKLCTIPKTKEQLEHITRFEGTPYRYGCACQIYSPKKEQEQVQFT